MAMTDDNDGVDVTSWEAIARKELAAKVERRAEEASAASWKVGAAFENNNLTDEEVKQYRHAIEALIYCVEQDVLRRTAEFDAFGGSTPFVENTGHAADYLNLTTAQANEASHGATVQLGTDDIRRLCNGHPVHAETEAGIDIEIAPKTLATNNPGP